jgi:hypothetical protein
VCGVWNFTVVVPGESAGDPCTCYQEVVHNYDSIEWPTLA